jgi:hypothetical protein
MRKAIFIATALTAAALMIAACGKKAVEGPAAEELKGKIAGVTGEVNAYLDAHNFSNTGAGALTAELRKLAGKYGELEKRAHDMRTQGGDEPYGDVGNLAGEGRAKVEALALVLEAGAPMGDAVKATALNDAVENWADYSDKVGAAPGEAAPVEGEEPGVGEPAEPGVDEPGEPGEPGEPVEPGEPGEPRYPGRGHHYGWWKNPEWARDRGTRPLTEGDVPGGREKESKREREHVKPGGGKGPSPGGETPGGAGGAGKGGGKGKGKGGQ